MRAVEGVLRVAHASSVDTLSVVLDRYSELHPEVAVGETDGEWPARDDLIASFERAAGCALHRVRVLIGAGQHVAALERTHAPAFLMMSSSRALPVERRLVGLVPLQPYFPWSLVWPTDAARAVMAFIDTARSVSTENGRLAVDDLPGMPWLP